VHSTDGTILSNLPIQADKRLRSLVSERQIAFSKSFTVRAASHAQISFNVAASRGAELTIQHKRDDALLARECRPLASGSTALEIKTHPEASHIACSLRIGGAAIDGARFGVDCGERILPTSRNFIVIGAMKAGTTTLFELLVQHSRLCRTWVYVPGKSFPKEINYFSKLYRTGHTPLHYDWRFPFDTARHDWTLDVSPNYAKLPGSRRVPSAIASLGGQTKVAYILRDPVDRIESHIAHTLRSGKQLKHTEHWIRTSRYALHLDNFTSHVPRENILLLDFEQLRRDPLALLATVCDFLGIERTASTSIVHNTRNIDFRLDPKQRAEFAEAVRPDVQRLISVYGFEPAETWLR
jgi:Sulfotransferase domain